MIKVDGHRNLYRDEISGAIVNTDSSAYDQYVSSLQRSRIQKEEMAKMKNDIDEIKSLLKLLTMDKNINI
jgi:hypothetical protein